MEQKVKIKVLYSLDNRETIIYLLREEKLLDALLRHSLHISNECGGRGTCGKCVVKVLEGTLEITSRDREIFSDSELLSGYRMACTAYPSKDCTIMLLSDISSKYNVVTEILRNSAYIRPSTDKIKASYSLFDYTSDGYAIAIDIGTTTLAMVLVAMSEGNILETYTAINTQRAYGADVISRIKASTEGKLQTLSQMIRMELLKGIYALLKKQSIGLDNIMKIIVSGNTTMIHLFMEYSCEGLGAYPFKPVSLELINTFSNDIFDLNNKIPITILPGISVFVGGDITAGLLSCCIDLEDKPCLFIDLGTNGEMVLGNKERLLVTSTAAGPAFEGGNISCGVGSIPGAICNLSIEGGRLSYDTIDKKPAIGICGTGVLELVSELLKEGIIDATGLLIDPYFDNGYPVADMRFTQGDIRQFQLAKAAIRAGVEILIKSYGISYEQLDKVYLAGGFGYHLDIDKAIRIGLLPKVATVNKTKIQAVGNTSLSGAVGILDDPLASSRMNHIISTSEEIHLSNNEEFNDLFIRYISF